MKELKGRVAVITGAGGGLGRALALELAARGTHLALVDVNLASLEETAQAVASHDVSVSQHSVDVTNRERMSQLPGHVVAAHGAVHLLINNAGITLQKSFVTHSLEDWDRIVGINWWGVLYACHFFHDLLAQAEEAHVVNLSSMSAFVGLPGQSSYCATKSAVQGLSESLYAEWAREGIGVTCVHPGALRTEMIQATLADSDDVKTAQRNYRLAQKIGVDADRAARQIVDGVVKGRMRVRIGRDAALLDWLKRLAPVAVHKPMLRLARSQMSTP